MIPVAVSIHRIYYDEDTLKFGLEPIEVTPEQALAVLLGSPNVTISASDDLVPCFDVAELAKRDLAKRRN